MSFKKYTCPICEKQGKETLLDIKEEFERDQKIIYYICYECNYNDYQIIKKRG